MITELTEMDHDLLRSWLISPAGERDDTSGYEPVVAGCMAMAMRVFEVMGKRLVRRPRSRYSELGDRPFTVAHTLWPVEASEIDLALEDAWTYVPALLQLYAPNPGPQASGEVRTALNRVVREAAVEQRCVTVVDVRYALRPILTLTY